MEKYFLTKGTEKKGPFLIEELLRMEITDDCLIWKNGFEKWKPVIEIEELKSKIIVTPPPTPFQQKLNNQKLAFISSLKITGIWLIIFWIIIFLVMGGWKDTDALQNYYGEGEYPIFGGGDVIRKALIKVSFVPAVGVSLIILFSSYRDKTKSTPKKDAYTGENESA